MFLGFGVIYGIYRDNGKDNGNYYLLFLGFRVIHGIYRDNGKDNGNYYLGLRIWCNMWDI